MIANRIHWNVTAAAASIATLVVMVWTMGSINQLSEDIRTNSRALEDCEREILVIEASLQEVREVVELSDSSSETRLEQIEGDLGARLDWIEDALLELRR